ncbi:unnamed protein product [Miscanthus lutarioriparius]|uniref:Uncharacterized protein n=1 Tax=Miscanthus lutarioriparius TaxID=422564 RepID=A0A811PQ77_9POAL|nr:unnamed protein product [Miscanthus lutarioriparius]
MSARGGLRASGVAASARGGERDEHPRRHALVAALPPRRGHKLISLDSDDDAFDGDSDEEEVAVQEWALKRELIDEYSPCVASPHACARSSPHSAGELWLSA